MLLACAGLRGPAVTGIRLGERALRRNGYGTHDWVLDNAIRMAGEKGEWVDSRTALLASDDPDSYGTNNYYHLFRDRASRGAQRRRSPTSTTKP